MKVRISIKSAERQGIVPFFFVGFADERRNISLYGDNDREW